MPETCLEARIHYGVPPTPTAKLWIYVQADGKENIIEGLGRKLLVKGLTCIVLKFPKEMKTSIFSSQLRQP